MRTFHEGKEPVFGDPLVTTLHVTLGGFWSQLGFLGVRLWESFHVLEHIVGAHKGSSLFLHWNNNIYQACAEPWANGSLAGMVTSALPDSVPHVEPRVLTLHLWLL